LQECLGDNYIPLRSHTLQATHIIVFGHRAVTHLCSGFTSSAIPTGLGNTLGNKGGVLVSFKIGNTSFAFVNAHLAAHQNGVKERNQNYHSISKGLSQFLDKKNKTGSLKSSIDIATIPRDSNNNISNSSNSNSNSTSLNSSLDTLSNKLLKVDAPIDSSSSLTSSTTSISNENLTLDKCADRVFIMIMLIIILIIILI
jgi:hypothetical protein